MPKIKKSNISAQDIANHGNYSSTIKSLNPFEAIRRRPGDRMGHIGNKGHENQVREIVQNSFDDALKETSCCDRVWCEYNEVEKKFTCIDNGNGIPFGMMYHIFTDVNTSSNFVAKDYTFTSGMHGVGSKAVNALSALFRVTSYECKAMSPKGKPSAHVIEFREGEVWKKGDKVTHELEIPNKDDFQGTMVEFIPSYVMGEVTNTCEDIRHLLCILVPLMPIGFEVTFHGIRADGTDYTSKIVNQDGIITYIISSMQGKPLIAPIIISDVSPKMKCDIAFTYDNKNIGYEVIHSFANNCPTLNVSGDRESSHTKAFYEGLTNFFRNYMNKVYLASYNQKAKNKIKVIAEDIRSGLNAVVTCSHIDPFFSGQAKEIFDKPEVEPYIVQVMATQLDEWTRTHGDDLQRLCKYFKDIADLRMKQDKEKIKITVKHKSVIDGAPAKFEKAIGINIPLEEREFIGVEGDSAMSSARKARDPKRQALYPFRGNMANAMTKSEKAYWGNEEAQDLRWIMGQDCTSKGHVYDINKCQYGKVIMMGDADADGGRIRQLFCKSMIVYYRPIIEHGRLFFANPPLYSINKNGKIIYFTVLTDYIEYVIKGFSKDVVILDSSKKRIPPSKLKHIIASNSMYKKMVDSASVTFSIDPHLLEFVLDHRGEKASKIQKALKKDFPYLKAMSENDTVVITGDYAGQYQTAMYSHFMDHKCKPIMDLLSKRCEEFFYINGQKSTLYDLMATYLKYQPSSVQRYKGLGEMNAIQLMQSTLHPDYNRTLMQVTVEDIDSEIKAIREINSNMKLLVKEIDFSAYRDL